LVKNITEAAKRESLLRDSLILSQDTNITDKNILLVDDIYRSGATLRAVTYVLYSKANVKNVYVIPITKTRSNR